MTKIILARHGETQYNVEGRVQGWLDSPLTEKGVAELTKQAQELKDSFSRVYSSPCMRAVRSAVILSSCNKKVAKFTTCEDLIEMHFVPWEGRLISEVSNTGYPSDFSTYSNDPANFVPAAGESFADVKARAVKAIKKIALENDGKTVLVVSHVAAISNVINYFDGNDIKDLWKHKVKSSSFTELYFDGDKFVKFGRIAHV